MTVGPQTQAKRVRERAKRKGALVLGNCTVADYRGRRKSKNPFSIHLLRMREIEKIIRARYGKMVPETDDPSIIEAVAYALNAYCIRQDLDFPEQLRNWCVRWAPWANDRAGEIVRPILNDLMRRRHDMKADDVARLLHVTMLERERLQLSTIGACDLKPGQRQRMAKNRKRERDRARQAAIRAESGTENRASWLKRNCTSEDKPWVAEGISRATWYRRRETGLSRLVIYGSGDTPVSNRSAVSTAAPVLALVQTLKGASLHPGQIGAGRDTGETEHSDIDETHRRLGVAI